MAQNNPSKSTFLTVEKKLSSDVGTSEVRVVGIDEYEGAAKCLTDAFAQDDVAMYFIDTPDNTTKSAAAKDAIHHNILRYLTAAHIYKGLVTTVGPDYGAVALWMPPGTDIDDWLTFFRSGLWRLYFSLSSEGRTRFYKEFTPLLHHTKAEVMGARDHDSWYLVYLGTKPEARGKGYAGKLIQHGIGLADAAGQATYLESSATANIPFYRRFGFEEKTTISLTRGPKNVDMHIMVREPKSQISSRQTPDSAKGLEMSETAKGKAMGLVEVGKGKGVEAVDALRRTVVAVQGL